MTLIPFCSEKKSSENLIFYTKYENSKVLTIVYLFISVDLQSKKNKRWKENTYVKIFLFFK